VFYPLCYFLSATKKLLDSSLSLPLQEILFQQSVTLNAKVVLEHKIIVMPVYLLITEVAKLLSAYVYLVTMTKTVLRPTAKNVL
jgi:hypothetical protein